MMITPTQHEKNEWSRFAKALYAKRLNMHGHIFSRFAALRTDQQIAVWMYDDLQKQYRAWLCFDEYPELETV